MVVAQRELAEAIDVLFCAIDHLRETHDATHRAGFGAHLAEFQKCPVGGNSPGAGVVNDYQLRQFERHATGRALVVAPAIAEGYERVQIEPQQHLPPARRFKPQPVPSALINEQPALAMRRVRMLYDELPLPKS